MKKKMGCLILGIMCLCLAGCGAKSYGLNQEQEKLVTEYATQLLVNHCLTSDKSFLTGQRLEEEELHEEELRERSRKIRESKEAYLQAEKEQQKESVTADTGKPDSDTAQNEETENEFESIGEFLNMPEFTISYRDCKICDSYPEEAREDDFLSITPSQGKKLLVLHFTAKNNTENEQMLDLYAKEVRYFLSVNGEKVVEASTTLLLDDLSMYRDKVPSEENRDLVLLYEVNADTDVQSLEMRIKCGEETGTVRLQ